VLAELEQSIEDAWQLTGTATTDVPEAEFARAVVDAPHEYEWRLVDAALDRLRCELCRSFLGRGARGCPPCDLADGFRFAAQEHDRPGVPRGNEHAVRVSTAILRAPHRYDDWIVDSNRLFLPLFVDGQMPTRRQQESLLAVRGRIRSELSDLEHATTFDELVERVSG
jgi:hypothetical protein